ncbi:UDP-N-acetylmuramoyl-tripeptide--D-alanyl-D-alanine ligase [Patescibacteria group bacterium]|nr:UDP-N-acetylmuramoyl-tripeptide--D-alanyl-D-alanine ligase [Patescibacteria group bacterium]MBU1922196.1 UDP-N-acetylmuramoyl-tripeptide--D-alanyl-D-alanine ligase [Patescibacteria group bacterium]
MKKIVQNILGFLAKQIINKYKPKIIGITGSMGKTSSKEAVFAVLSAKHRVRRNIKNYNNEIGVPLTVIGESSALKSVWRWSGIFWRALQLLIFKDEAYPQILILEMGADRPGDIKYLTNMARCDVGVVTTIAPVHVEFFKDIKGVIREKQIMVDHLAHDRLAILNYDDRNVWEMSRGVKTKVLSFGFFEGADIRAVEYSNKFIPDQARPETEIAGVTFKLIYNGNVVPVNLPAVLGKAHVYAALVGAACGIHFGVNLVDIAEALKNYQAPRGRMRIIKGIKNTWLLDDTYNASPLATLTAIHALAELGIYESGRRWAVLGDMLELGSFTEKGHFDVGKRIGEMGIDYLVTVGEKAKDTAKAAQEHGISQDHIYSFGSSPEAGRFLQDRVQENDVILVKGSQGMRMEQIVKELMAEPLAAGDLLCRQDETWLKK